MELRWTENAAADLEQIADFLFEKTPERAARIVLQVYQAPEALIQFPFRGRPGRVPGTREFALPSLPFISIYAISDEVIHISRILHGGQQYP